MTEQQIIEQVRELYDVEELSDEEVLDYYYDELDPEELEVDEQAEKAVLELFKDWTEQEKKEFLRSL